MSVTTHSHSVALSTRLPTRHSAALASNEPPMDLAAAAPDCVRELLFLAAEELKDESELAAVAAAASGGSVKRLRRCLSGMKEGSNPSADFSADFTH